ncbi:MAG: pilus assembly protein [Chloroflexi bacterium]|nr:pilus assembly protein [Chloroflexota bacterium]
MLIRKLIRRYRDRSLGQSLVEFAIVLPVFLVILSAAIDLGRIAYARVTIANVAREASFQAAQTPTSYVAGQACDQNTNLVICRGILESKGSVVTVNPADIVLTCQASDGSSIACSSTPAMGKTVAVKATGQFTLLTPVIAVFFGGTNVTFSSTAINQIGALPATTLTTSSSTSTTSTSTSTTSTTSTSTTTTSTTTTSTTTTPNCAGVSAAFTKTSSPANNKSPVTVTVTDTTTYNASCSTVWAWSWGDGTTTYGQTQAPHVYYNQTGANGNTKTFNLTLTVTSGTFTSTSGASVISVVK